jgi:hypothetical protein
MKNAIFILLILFSINTNANEECPGMAQEAASPKPEADKASSAMAIIAHKSTNDLTVKVEASSTYLTSIIGHDDFSEADAKQFLASVEPVCLNKSLEAKFISKACLVASGLSGKVAKKLGMGGVEAGKMSYSYLKKSLESDPMNADAIYGHAKVVIGFVKDTSFTGRIKKNLAEKALDTNFIKEAKLAKEAFERIHKTDDPIYKQILEILN